MEDNHYISFDNLQVSPIESNENNIIIAERVIHSPIHVLAEEVNEYPELIVTSNLNVVTVRCSSTCRIMENQRNNLQQSTINYYTRLYDHYMCKLFFIKILIIIVFFGFCIVLIFFTRKT
jgi:hypothetical protein